MTTPFSLKKIEAGDVCFHINLNCGHYFNQQFARKFLLPREAVYNSAIKMSASRVLN